MCLALLVTAATLRADPRGHGTHEQLGLPRCAWLGTFGRPCMTCGMTTAFAHAGNGQWWSSVKTQPVGALGALGAAGLFWPALHTALSGSRAFELCGKLLRPKALWAAGAAVAAAWAYKLWTFEP